MNKQRSLPFYLLTYFIITSLVTFTLLGSYIAYNYYRELRQNLANSLQVMADDVVHHKLYTQNPKELKRTFHLFEDYHQAAYVQLFKELEFHYFATPPLVQSDSISVVRQLPDGRYLFVGSSLKSVQEKTLELVLKLLVVFGSVLLLFILIFALLLNRLFFPLRCLVRFCREGSDNRTKIRNCEGTSEISHLKDAIVELLDAKQSLFKEAAHELKSPIAVLKARLSLYRQDETYEKTLFVNESLADIATISNKLKELLFLKEMEQNMRHQKEHLDMREQCYLMQQAFRPILQKKELLLEANWDENFSLYAHKEAVTRVMQALFENIFLHTKNGSTIHVDVNACQKRLKITNEIGGRSDETLFSSCIGSALIQRLCSQMGYRYENLEGPTRYTTLISFASDTRG